MAAAPAMALDPTSFSDNPASGVTLREAITGTAAGGTITLQAGTYELSLGAGAGNYDDNNSSGDLDITKPLTIVGAGTNSTVIRNANPGVVDGVFHVVNTLNISNLTVTGGVRPTNPPSSEQRGYGAGGAFRVGTTGGDAGTLNASSVKITGNQAFQGAAVFVSGTATRSRATLTDSIVYLNLASNFGGGISAFNDVVLNRTSVIANKANYGGGLMLWTNPRATLDATNSTIGLNQAILNGGGLQTGGTLNFDFTTIAGNTAEGGRNVQFDGGTINIANSVIAGSQDNSCRGLAPGDLRSGGYNVDQGQTCIPAADTDGDGDVEPTNPTDRINVPDTTPPSGGPALLLENPSPAANTWWFTPRPGSALIDTGTDFCFQPIDQRGFTRPQGSRCDVGSIEREAPKLVDVGIESFVEYPDPIKAGQDLTYEFTVRNVGNETAPDVVVTTSIPATTLFVDASPGCSRPRPDSVRCELGAIAPGAAVTKALIVRTTEPGVLNNRADVSVGGGLDVNKGNDQRLTSATVEAPGAGPGPGPDPDPKLTVALDKKVKQRKARKLAFDVTANRANSNVDLSLFSSKHGTLATKRTRFTEAGQQTITLTLKKSAFRKLKRLKKGSRLTVEASWALASGQTIRDSITLVITKKRTIVAR